MAKAAKKPKIAAAAMTTSSSGGLGSRGLGQAIEAAMAQAVNDCFKKGVTDDDSVREAKLAARERVKQEFAAAEAKAAKEAAKAAEKG
jgi:hypothetical protein